MPRDHPSSIVSKRMILLLRHGTILSREEDGAIEFRNLKEDLMSKFQNSVRWSEKTWVDHFETGRGKIYSSSVRITLDHQFDTSELSKVMWETILWIIFIGDFMWLLRVRLPRWNPSLLQDYCGEGEGENSWKRSTNCLHNLGSHGQKLG